MKKQTSRTFYILTIIVLVIIIILLLITINSRVHQFRTYQGYFRNNTNITIEPWMTTQNIIRHFNITEDSLFNKLNLTKDRNNLRTTINQICINKNTDCNVLVKELNQMIK